MAATRFVKAISRVTSEERFDPGRRKFAKLALAGTLGGTVAFARPARTAPTVHENPPGMKICAQIGSDPSEQELQFVRQLGVDYVSVWVRGEQATEENFRRLREKVEKAGLKVWNIGNGNVHNMPEVTLNLPGRDQKIEEYKAYLRNLGKAGVYYTTYAHMANGIWSTESETTRGGAVSRAFDLGKHPKGTWQEKTYTGPLSHGRVFSKDEIWENYTYFIKAVVPVAEQEGIRIGIHPDDPPVPELGGVPRCLFASFDGYKRALEIANSPNVGLCLCCGCWLEGGTWMGKSVLQAIGYFGGERKIFKIHFRNVSAPLPHFVETFVDNGYMDMYQVMKALREVRYDGALIPDHIPQMVDRRMVGTAYTIAYMKALLARANEEAAA